MGSHRAAAAGRAGAEGAARQAAQSDLHERDVLRRQDGRAVARSAGAVRAVEDGVRAVQSVESGGRVRAGPAGVHRRGRPRGGHRGLDLHPGASARRGWKRGAQRQCIGRSRGGLTTKIHALVDGLGNPVHLHLTPGNVNDITEAPRLVEKARGKYFIADRGYDSRAVAEAVEAKGMTVVIPTQADRTQRRKIDWHVYKERHLVENFFCRLKHYRRVATRFDKTALSFLGFVTLVAIRIWMA